MKNIREITIDSNATNQRFDRFCRKYFKPYEGVGLTEIYKRIRKGDIRVNGKKSTENYQLQIGDVVLVKDFVLRQLPPVSREEKIAELDIAEIRKYIVYEDENWLVFDKPAGVPMHGGTKNTETLCMNNYLEKYIAESIGDHPTFKPSFCYRLDKDTSGILIAAKNYQALQYLNEQIRQRNTDKKYFTIVAGNPPSEGMIDLPLEQGYDKKFGRGITQVAKNGKTAKTTFTTLKTLDHRIVGNIALLEVKIYTGRMHQIRVHLAHLGYPVLGDIIYGNPMINRKLYKDLKINRQILHCKQYSFTDLDGTTKRFTTTIPQDIIKVCGKIRM